MAAAPSGHHLHGDPSPDLRRALGRRPLAGSCLGGTTSCSSISTDTRRYRPTRAPRARTPSWRGDRCRQHGRGPGSPCRSGLRRRAPGGRCGHRSGARHPRRSTGGLARLVLHMRSVPHVTVADGRRPSRPCTPRSGRTGVRRVARGAPAATSRRRGRAGHAGAGRRVPRDHPRPSPRPERARTPPCGTRSSTCSRSPPSIHRSPRSTCAVPVRRSARAVTSMSSARSPTRLTAHLIRLRQSVGRAIDAVAGRVTRAPARGLRRVRHRAARLRRTGHRRSQHEPSPCRSCPWA